MRVIVNKKQKFVRIHPAPQKDIKGGLNLLMNKSFIPPAGGSQVMFTDIIKGQALYKVDKNMRGKIIEAKIIEL